VTTKRVEPSIVSVAYLRKDLAMHRVVVVALENVMPFELGIPDLIFGAAYDDDGRPLYQVVTCSLDGGAVRTSADYQIVVDHGPEVVSTADTVVLPPAPARVPWPQAPELPPGLGEVLDTVRPDCRLVSLCGAAFFLAATGRLTGRPATTHWILEQHFRTRYPSIEFDPAVLFIDDGDILTAAGAAAGIDLCLHLVRRDHGSAVANRVARVCVVPPFREGGQAQYIARPTPEPIAATTAPARAWAMAHLSQRITLSQLASEANMSVRTFTRRFREEMGTTPGAWLAQQRVDLARSLLETCDSSIEDVARSAGLGTGSGLRQHFQRTVGIAPVAYRRTFRASAGGEPPVEARS
jgi:transcriptional regulator GlxA family with amidase domain